MFYLLIVVHPLAHQYGAIGLLFQVTQNQNSEHPVVKPLLMGFEQLGTDLSITDHAQSLLSDVVSDFVFQMLLVNVKSRH